MDQLFAYVIAFIISMGFVASSGSSIPVGLQEQAVTQEVSQVNNLGAGNQGGCDATSFTCSGSPYTNGTAANAAVWSGYVSVTPLGAYDTKNFQVLQSVSAYTGNTNIITYSGAAIPGSLLQSFSVYSLTADSATKATSVTGPSSPSSTSSYYLVYDKCLSGIYLSAAKPTMSSCP